MKTFKFNQKPRNRLRLDPGFAPMILGNHAFEETVKASKNPVKVTISVERSGNQIASVNCDVFNAEEGQGEANYIYVERLVKTLLWLKGGFKVYIAGDDIIGDRIKKTYKENGDRAFDSELMSSVYQESFEVVVCSMENIPLSNEVSKPIGRYLDGNRIGFDAGGSDRKVSAVIDGKSVFSEEVIWHPKTTADPNYHYDGIMDSMKRAASYLPSVDAIGVSSAGIFIDNQVAVASLFRQVPKDLFELKVRNMYFDIQKEFNNVPLEVVNDGDVTALAGAMSLNSNNVLGIAMGTAEAAGYVDHLGNITGWLNELAFVPVDYNQDAMIDEWSGDYGVGVTYFSQDAVIKLCKPAGIELPDELSPAEKLKYVQGLVSEGNEDAKEIFRTIGVYLGYTLAYYARFYDIKHVLILGRLTSGFGGVLLLENAQEVLKNEFPLLNDKISVFLPDEKSRRVGQSIAAASLPQII